MGRMIGLAAMVPLMFTALAAWAAAPVEERQPGVEPLANQQQRASFAKARLERAEQDERAAHAEVEELSKAVKAAEEGLAAQRARLEAARLREAGARQRREEARSLADKAAGALPSR